MPDTTIAALESSAEKPALDSTRFASSHRHRLIQFGVKLPALRNVMRLAARSVMPRKPIRSPRT